MLAAYSPTNIERARAAAPVVLVHALLAYALLFGLGVAPGSAPENPLKLIDIPPVPPVTEDIPPPPPPSTGETESPRRADPREEGAASPPNLESRASAVVAPERVPLRPPPLPAAKVAGTGSDPSSGAAQVAGPGTGSGGVGSGTGSGDGGGGAGAGGGGGYGDGGGLRRPRHVRGRLRDSDYPAELGAAGVYGRVGIRYAIEVDGRVTDCTITRSSGSAILDRTTCELIEQRFRYDPARDRYGRPIRSNLIESYEWLVQDDPEEEEAPQRRRRRLF